MRASRWAIVVAVLALAGALLAARSCGQAATDSRSPAANGGEAATGRADGGHADTEKAAGAPESQPRARRARAADVPPPESDAAPAGKEPADETGVSVEFVDENGAPVPGGTVRFGFTQDVRPLDERGAESVRQVLLAWCRSAPGGPIVFRALQAYADGVHLRAYGDVPGLPPIVPVEFTVYTGRIEKVRLVAAQPRTADVIVVSAATDQPVAGARVVPATENLRRGQAGLDDLATAVTGADGRCRVLGLGLGEHEFEVNADGFRQSDVRWTGGELRVRLEPQEGNCTVKVKVLGPDGVPVPDFEVSLVGTDRVLETDAAGQVVFKDVDANVVMVTLNELDWEELVESRNWKNAKPRSEAIVVQAESGATYELLLGIAPAGTGSIEGRLVDEDGAPIAGAEMKVFDVGNAEKSAVTDETGNVLFTPLPRGEFRVCVDLDSGSSWYLDEIELEEGGRERTTWKLGTIKVRGRVVTGPDLHGVGGVTVWFRGSASGVTHCDADGRFELTRARAGTYKVDASSGTATTVDRSVTIPADGEVIVELIEYGRVAVRFHADDRDRLRTAKVWLYAAGTKDPVASLEPGTGDFDLLQPKVLPGRYDIEVRIDDVKRRFPVEVKSGETSVVEIRAP